MVVVSPTISITVQEPPKIYTLTIDVWPKTGQIGDTFRFSGLVLQDGIPFPGQIADLDLEGVGGVGSDTTGVDGDYLINWVADRAGTLRFHAKAPYLVAESEAVALDIQAAQIPAEAWMIPAVAGGLALFMVLTAVVFSEVEKWWPR